MIGKITKENNRLWIWGYVFKDIPSAVPFMGSQKCWCSLETACDYFKADNAVFMNPTHNLDDLNDELYQYLEDRKSVVIGLTHGKYAEAAEAVSKFSLKHPNVTGAIIDDFLDHKWDFYAGPSKFMKPEELKVIYENLKKHNPNLKLYVVRYTWQNPDDLLPFTDYFDVLNLWVWTSTYDFWVSDYQNTVARLYAMYHKPILQGVFLHHYGYCDVDHPPMDPKLIELQCDRIALELRRNHLDGWCFLQNGWFCHTDHRETILAAKKAIDWFYGTTTFR